MKINGIDIKKYDAKQLTADVQPPSFSNSYEWLTSAALPTEFETEHRNPNRADPRQQRGGQWQAAEGIQCAKAGPARQKHRPMGCAAPGDLQRKVRGTAHGKQHQLPRRSQTVETNRHTNAPCTVWKNDPVILCHSMCRGRSL